MDTYSNETRSVTVADPANAASRTELGKKLRAIRRRIVDSGERLLSPEEVDCEVAIRRGEHDPHVS